MHQISYRLVIHIHNGTNIFIFLLFYIILFFLLKYLFQISDIRPEVFLYIPDFILIP